MTDNELLFADEDSSIDKGTYLKPWKIAIVDDDQDVHHVSKLAMRNIEYLGRKIEFIHAYSGEEGVQLIRDNPDTALLFLDVVMEKDDSGLQAVHKIREDLNNYLVRIILRTGQPGMAPERDVIYQYDINDYKEKHELTADKLYTTVISSLRSYEGLMRIERSRQGLRHLIFSTGKLFSANSHDQLISSLLEQILSLTGMEENAFFGQDAVFIGEKRPQKSDDDCELCVVGGIGRYSNETGHSIKSVVSHEVFKVIRKVQESEKSFFSKEFSVIHMCQPFEKGVIFIEGNNIVPDSMERDLLELLGCEASNARQNVLLNEELNTTLKEVVYMLGTLTEFRSEETQNHVVRVSKFAGLLGEKLGLDYAENKLLRLAATMHDVGKVGIPDHILHKQGKLTPEEFEIMKTHTTIGLESLKFSDRPLFKAAAIIAHQHQEKWDGSGYPQGLSGEKIHIYARITAIADVFDALSYKRCYSDAWDYHRVKDHMCQDRGVHFDSKLLELFFSDEDAIMEIMEKYKNGLPRE